MGFNTVFFGLNDLASEYAKSPNAFAFILGNAYGFTSSHAEHYWESAYSIAKKHGEPWPNRQALRPIACFHASHTSFFMAGQNSMKSLNVVRYGKTKDGRKTVTLEIPE